MRVLFLKMSFMPEQARKEGASVDNLVRKGPIRRPPQFSFFTKKIGVDSRWRSEATLWITCSRQGAANARPVAQFWGYRQKSVSGSIIF